MLNRLFLSLINGLYSGMSEIQMMRGKAECMGVSFYFEHGGKGQSDFRGTDDCIIEKL